MHKYHSKGATDVTGFGYLGHAQNLATNQKAEVDFIIDVLPILPKMVAVNEIFNFKLTEGYSAETSGRVPNRSLHCAHFCCQRCSIPSHHTKTTHHL